MSYVYQRANGENFYVVGFFDPSGEWHAESDQDTREAAAERVHWLNGGRSLDYKPCHDTGSEGYEQ